MDKELTLGKAPALHRDGAAQCAGFKAFMTNHIGRVDGAFLSIFHDGEKSGVRVIYDPDICGALAYAKQAEELAEMVWEEVIHKKEPEYRILIRKKIEETNGRAERETKGRNGFHR